MAADGTRRMTKTGRDRIWQSIRILRVFTMPDLMRTSGARYDNTKRYVRWLETHGIIAEARPYAGGRAGEYRAYRLVRETAKRPVLCTRCGRPITDPACEEVQHEN